MKIFNSIYKLSACALLSVSLLTACHDDTLLPSAGQGAPSATAEDFPWAPGTAIIKLKNSPSGGTRAASAIVTRAKVFDNSEVKVEQVFDMTNEYANLKRQMGLDRWFVVKFPKDKDVSEVLKELRKDPAIEEANGDITVVPTQTTYTPAKPVTRAPINQQTMNPANDGTLGFTDPYLKYQWHYMTTRDVYNYFKPGVDINLFPAWQVTTGDPKVVVAIIDSGVDFTHPDLQKSAWEGKDEEGRPIHGRNFYNQSIGLTGEALNEIIPGNHGTHVGGTVAARNNNSVGVCGVAGGSGSDDTGVRLMSCEIYGEDGKAQTANTQSIARAFEFAAEHGALIANCSWGYEFDRQKYFNNEIFQERFKNAFDLLKTGIDYFTKTAGCDASGNKKPDSYMKGGLVFFASGNDGQKDIEMIPASYDKVVAVGAFSSYDGKATDYMDKGPWVDILAPGGTTEERMVPKGILSTVPKAFVNQSTGNYPNIDFVLPESNDYAYAQGTSMATPHVTGIAALVISKFGKNNPNFTNEDLRKRILSAVKAKSPYVYGITEDLKGKLGAGFIDAAMALADPETKAPEKPVITAVNYDNDPLKGYYNGTIKWQVTADEDAISEEKKAYAYDIELFEKGKMTTPVQKATVYSYENAVGTELSYDFADLKTNMDYEVHMTARDRFDNKSDIGICNFKTRFNHEPKITKEIPAKLILPDTQPFYHVLLPVVDEDNHTWTYKNTVLPSGVELKRQGNGLDLLIKVGARGTFNFDITLTDELGGSSVQHINYEVVSHSGPVVTAPLADVSLFEHGEAVTIDLSHVYEIPAGSSISFAAKSNENDIVKADIDGTKLKLTPGKSGMATITLTANDGISKSMTTFQVRVSKKGGGEAYAVYPVPAHSYIKVLMHSDVKEVEAVVTSVRGQKLIDERLTVPSTTHEITLGVDRLAPNTYYLLLKTNRGTSKHTFIKK